MEHLLFVDACLRGADSRTLRLCNVWLEEYRRRCPDGVIEHVSLAQMAPLPLRADDLARRDFLVSQGHLNDPMLAPAVQFARADRILIGAPYWDLLFPAALRAYLEQICVCGIAFHYTEHGSEGLCRAKKLDYLTTAGGFIGENNFGFDYIQGLCTLLGIPETACAYAEGLDIIGMDTDAQMAEGVERVRALF